MDKMGSPSRAQTWWLGRGPAPADLPSGAKRRLASVQTGAAMHAKRIARASCTGAGHGQRAPVTQEGAGRAWPSI